MYDLDPSAFSALPAAFYASQAPTPLPAPYLVAYNGELAEQLDLPSKPAAPLPELLGGNRLPAGTQPLAAAYAGHQFGIYVPQLGDGRALLLGELSDRAGQRHEVQLKGAGRTPFSRGADGRAVLRSTIREYLASEAMHGLGIPTRPAARRPWTTSAA